jgi:hypothetical protein
VTPRKRDNDMVYVYGIVADTFDAVEAPQGVDTRPVTVVRHAPIAALTSRVAASEYAPEVIEQRSGDVSWLSPRALAHDRVLTWAQERDVVVPLPIFSLWASDESLARSLDEQRDDLTRTMKLVSGADEFGLRVHRRDAELLVSLGETDPELRRLHAEAQGASPGQRYLLERKLAEQGKQGLKTAGRRRASEIFEQLAGLSRAAVARPLSPDAGRADELTMVLNGAFLVERAHLDTFREAVASIIRAHESRGLAFDFTGPWPPYNFVGERGTPMASTPARA